MTSLNMPGFSLTLLLLPRDGEGKYSSTQILQLLDAQADAPGWAWTSKSEPGKLDAKTAEAEVAKTKEIDLARELLSTDKWHPEH